MSRWGRWVVLAPLGVLAVVLVAAIALGRWGGNEIDGVFGRPGLLYAGPTLDPAPFDRSAYFNTARDVCRGWGVEGVAQELGTDAADPVDVAKAYGENGYGAGEEMRSRGVCAASSRNGATTSRNAGARLTHRFHDLLALPRESCEVPRRSPSS